MLSNSWFNPSLTYTLHDSQRSGRHKQLRPTHCLDCCVILHHKSGPIIRGLALVSVVLTLKNCMSSCFSIPNSWHFIVSWSINNKNTMIILHSNFVFHSSEYMYRGGMWVRKNWVFLLINYNIWYQNCHFLFNAFHSQDESNEKIWLFGKLRGERLRGMK